MYSLIVMWYGWLDIFMGNFGTFLKRQLYNYSLPPEMSWRAETWIFTNQAKTS